MSRERLAIASPGLEGYGAGRPVAFWQTPRRTGFVYMYSEPGAKGFLAYDCMDPT